MPRVNTPLAFIRDAQVINSQRRSTIIDFIEWEDDAASATYVNDRLQRSGIQCRLHDVDPQLLTSLPSGVLDRPVVRVEIAVDLFPKRYGDETEHVRQLADTYNVLARRLAPWGSEFLDQRVWRQWGPKKRDGSHLIYPGEALPWIPVARSGPWLSERDRYLPVAGVGIGASLLGEETLYFGHEIGDEWSYVDPRPPLARVRLYIKMLDRRKPLPREEWRTRMEVTFNHRASRDVLGAIKVGDLLHTNYRALGSTYFRLARPVAWISGNTIPRRPKHIRRLVGHALRTAAAREEREAVQQGNAFRYETGRLQFRTLPALTDAIKEPLENYSKRINRFRAKAS